MHESVLIEISRLLSDDDIRGKSVIELGSRNVNGSIRPYIEKLNPASYIGVDFIPGRGVDLVTDVCTYIPEKSADIVISTEMLEHTEDFLSAVNTIKKSCKIGGFLIISTRSPGFPYHGYPYDYWRYTKQNILDLFCDCKILHLINDWQSPGIIMIAKRTDSIMNLGGYHPHKAPVPPSFTYRKISEIKMICGGILHFFGI
jgi:SAM-dependent methyltransferase